MTGLDPIEPPSEPSTEPAPVVDPGRDAEPEPIEERVRDAEPDAEPHLEDDAERDEAPGADPDPQAEPDPEPPAGPVTVGRMVADALRRAGVRWAFTVPGESFLGLLEGLEGAGINIVATRHEGAAAFMAEAHGQLTGRPAVAIGTRAVGASNLAIGIHTATADSTPMFALVGGVERAARGREGFQEIDLPGTIGRLAKWAADPQTPAEAVAATGEAVRQALGGRPGPALLALAEDLLDESVPEGLTVDGGRTTPPRPGEADVLSVLRLLTSGRRPVILAGGGVLRARTSNDLVRFAELLRIPVIAAWRRGDVIPNDHPLYLGMTGYGSPASVRERLASADTMLVIGCRLSEIASFGWSVPGPGVRWAHVDVAPVRPSGALTAPDLAVASDARLFLRAAIARLQEHGVLHAGWADARAADNTSDRERFEAETVVDAHPWNGPGVHPGRVIASLRRVLPDDAVLTTDAGSFAGWAARGFRFRRPGTFLGPTSGAMGYGLPAAIAAGLVHRDRAVAALVGDGGLGMTLAELETAVRMRLRTIVLVFDNEAYGMIRTYQGRRGGGSAPATDLGPVDWAAAARALGARGIRVDTDAAVEPALRQALTADRPTLVHLVVDRRWESVDSRP